MTVLYFSLYLCNYSYIAGTISIDLTAVCSCNVGFVNFQTLMTIEQNIFRPHAFLYLKRKRGKLPVSHKFLLTGNYQYSNQILWCFTYNWKQFDLTGFKYLINISVSTATVCTYSKIYSQLFKLFHTTHSITPC